MAFPVGAVVAGVGALGSLFSKRRKNPYEEPMNQAASRLTASRNSLDLVGDSGRSLFAEADGGFRNQARSVLDLLKEDPYTDSFSTRRLAEGTAGMAGDAEAAKANLQADLTRRGIAGGGAETGGLAAIEAAKASAMAQARANLTREQVGSRESRQLTALDLLGGMRGTGLNQSLAVAGSQANMDQATMQLLANLFQNREQMTMAQQGQLLGLLGGLGQQAGSWFGGK